MCVSEQTALIMYPNIVMKLKGGRRKGKSRSVQKQFKIGALVQYKHGQWAGVISYLVADPYSGQITHLVIDRSKEQASSKIIARNIIANIQYNGQTVRLAITPGQLSALSDFVESDFISAPGPFGGASRPFYLSQGQGKIPLGTTYLYPLTAQTLPLTAEKTIVGLGQLYARPKLRVTNINPTIS
jgi:hypothetical protein